jgi:bifunctional non-homologous end joining protein LigD
MEAMSTGPPRFKPMLASAGAIRGEGDAYAFEPKLDGWRAIVTVGSDRVVEVRTRHGRVVTASVPELAGLAAAVGERGVVLDGELVAHRGTPSSFYRLSGRMAARRPVAVDVARVRTPVTFVAFDVLWLDADVTALAYRDRRQRLEGLELQGPAWCTVSSFPGAGPELFAACHALGLEGLVAKRLDSPYEPGVRSKAWVKAKCAAWLADHAGHRHAH